MVGLVATLAMLGAPIVQSAASPASVSFEDLSKRAQQARDAARLDEALKLYEEGLQVKPDWEEGLWNAGSISYDRDQYQECAKNFQRLTEIKRDLAPAWTMYGLCEYRLRFFEAALDSFRHVEQLGFQENPELARTARLHLAIVLTKTGRFEEAIIHLTDLVRTDKKTPQISIAAGIAGLREPWLASEVPENKRDLAFRLGDAMTAGMEQDFKTCIQKFQALEADYPKEPNVHFRFGAYLMLQDSAKGIEQINETVALDPRHVPALVGLSVIYLEQQQTDKAIRYATEAAAASPNDFSAHVALGRALLENNSLDKAIPELELAVKLAPDNAEARFSLASAYSHAGRKDDASRERDMFKRLTKLKNSEQP